MSQSKKYREVYELYQLCSNGKDLKKFCIDVGVNCMLNQWDSLRNFILDGRVQLSNNLCEQRMKPIKLNLKVCQNIGSETAAENASFMFSLMESCKLNKLKEEPYMETLFNSLCMEQVDWKRNLPCFYKQ